MMQRLPNTNTGTDDAPLPVKNSEDIKQIQNGNYEIALPEKRHLVWNQSSY
jgi:hypothetical protein